MWFIFHSESSRLHLEPLKHSPFEYIEGNAVLPDCSGLRLIDYIAQSKGGKLCLVQLNYIDILSRIYLNRA